MERVAAVAAQSAFGVSLAHTSEPHDREPRLDPDGRVHIVAAVPTRPAVTTLLAEFVRAGAKRLDIIHTGVTPQDVPGARITRARDAAEVELLLRDRLAASTVGVRLYVLGDEGFVRRAAVLALQVGLERDELQLAITGSAARRVWCVHCKAITEDVTTTVEDCSGCGRKLFVYHHFSRRHGAYMGFQADAEVAGDLPEVRSAWR